MAEVPESILLLRSIDASLKALLKTHAAPASGGTIVASDADLDGQWGNPVIKAKSPRDWTGDDMTGKRFSECPADYLSLLADRYDYFSTKPDADEKAVKYARLDAARARGWAARIRSGKVAPPADEDKPEPVAEW